MIALPSPLILAAVALDDAREHLALALALVAVRARRLVRQARRVVG